MAQSQLIARGARRPVAVSTAGRALRLPPPSAWRRLAAKQMRATAHVEPQTGSSAEFPGGRPRDRSPSMAYSGRTSRRALPVLAYRRQDQPVTPRVSATTHAHRPAAVLAGCRRCAPRHRRRRCATRHARMPRSPAPSTPEHRLQTPARRSCSVAAGAAGPSRSSAATPRRCVS